MQNNPLAKYYRQPKIYLSLPSKGQFYPEGVIDGDPDCLPVFGMTAMDEIMLRTPDALFTGESVVEVIKSCIPGIKEPWAVPQLDIDSILIALRIATYGEKMPMNYNCKECKTSNDIDLDLSLTLDYYQQQVYNSVIEVDDLKINIRPLTYKEQTQMALDTYQLQKQLYAVKQISNEEEQNEALNAASKRLNHIQVESFRKCIESIQVGKQLVTNQEHISEWFRNSDKEYYKRIKDHLLDIRKTWSVPEQVTLCSECGHENHIEVGFDNSNFFGNP